MANPKNLIPQAHVLTVEDSSKGGKRSAEVRKEKKAIKNILEDYLNSNCSDNPQLEMLAEKVGLSGEDSKKQLFTVACVLNSLRDGNLRDLQLMQELLHENVEISAEQEIEDDPLTKSLIEEAERMDGDADK